MEYGKTESGHTFDKGCEISRKTLAKAKLLQHEIEILIDDLEVDWPDLYSFLTRSGRICKENGDKMSKSGHFALKHSDKIFGEHVARLRIIYSELKVKILSSFI